MKKSTFASISLVTAAIIIVAFSFRTQTVRACLNAERKSDLYGFVPAPGQGCQLLGESNPGDSPIRSYWFDASSMATDDGESVLRPSSIPSIDPGRWLKVDRYQQQGDWAQSSSSALDFIKNKPSALAPSGTAGGDLSGSYPNPSVIFPGSSCPTVYASGTVYALTNTMQKVDFGTTDPAITIPSPGTYILHVNVRLGYNGLVSLTSRTAELKLRRTNNTASDVPNSVTRFLTPVAAVALTTSAGDCDVPTIKYTTTNSNDVIELWGNLSGASLSGVEVQEASIVAQKITN
jgi:hypothetical protein